MKISFSALCILLLSIVVLSSCQKETLLDLSSAPPVAEAGPPQSLTTFSTTLTGSGTTTNGSIVGYLWSLVSGPNVPVISSPSSSVTEVSNMVIGTYVFQFAVIDSDGLTGVDVTTVTITDNPAPQIHTLTLQPANNPAEWHFWGNANQNQSGHATQIGAGAWTNAGEAIFVRGAVKFDFSAIPSTATIVSAKLSLYSTPDPKDGNLTDANSGSNNSFYIRMINSSWTAAGSTWANQPTTTATNQVSVPHTSAAFFDVIDADVTALVQSMHSSTNNGFMIQLQNETVGNMRQFSSSVHANTTKHPKLVITYQQ